MWLPAPFPTAAVGLFGSLMVLTAPDMHAALPSAALVAEVRAPSAAPAFAAPPVNNEQQLGERRVNNVVLATPQEAKELDIERRKLPDLKVPPGSDLERMLKSGGSSVDPTSHSQGR
ncbi:hypothetical protein AB1Y20_018648 [Prymnesium parvum]|uniref:Uncharacterized protein n=1 Tax=Prymnesium parvum TaxID=97485 RepID=A0AB34JSE4_PRYPA